MAAFWICFLLLCFGDQARKVPGIDSLKNKRSKRHWDHRASGTGKGKYGPNIKTNMEKRERKRERERERGRGRQGDRERGGEGERERSQTDSQTDRERDRAIERERATEREREKKRSERTNLQGDHHHWLGLCHRRDPQGNASAALSLKKAERPPMSQCYVLRTLLLVHVHRSQTVATETELKEEKSQPKFRYLEFPGPL